MLCDDYGLWCYILEKETLDGWDGFFVPEVSEVPEVSVYRGVLVECRRRLGDMVGSEIIKYKDRILLIA